MPIAFQAALGDEIIVPALMAGFIPIQQELSQRLFSDSKGKGVKNVRNNRMGDLYVRVQLEVPTSNTKQRKAIEDMDARL